MTHQLSLLDAPTHRDDPASSVEAAERVTPKVGSLLYELLWWLTATGPYGRSNRELQILIYGTQGANPTAWNKIPTRCRTLERMGLIKLVVDIDGKPLLRDHRDGGRFLLWRVA